MKATGTLNLRKEISKIGLSWLKEILDISFLSRDSFQIKAQQDFSFTSISTMHVGL
jgi:hypothetical protein